MPSVDELGIEYTSFPIHFGDDNGGYEVRIIAANNNTDVSVPVFDIDISLSNPGDYHVVDNRVTRFAYKMFCSKPCMVVQITRSLSSGGSENTEMGSFMAVLTPDEQASNSLIFTVPNMINHAEGVDGAISIVMNTYPVTGLHLNETSLAGLSWQLVENSTGCYASMSIDEGFYRLYSNESSERWVQTVVH